MELSAVLVVLHSPSIRRNGVRFGYFADLGWFRLVFQTLRYSVRKQSKLLANRNTEIEESRGTPVIYDLIV